jgi:transcriptional regulator with XRE-family HTH domain
MHVYSPGVIMSRKKSLDVNKIIDRAKLVLGFKTDYQLADALNIKPTAISMWKRRGNIDLKSIITICEDVSTDWLLYGKGDMNPDAQNEDDITEKINMMLKNMDMDQRRDVLKYAEKEELFKKMKELYKAKAA